MANNFPKLTKVTGHRVKYHYITTKKVNTRKPYLLTSHTLAENKIQKENCNTIRKKQLTSKEQQRD